MENAYRNTKRYILITCTMSLLAACYQHPESVSTAAETAPSDLKLAPQSQKHARYVASDSMATSIVSQNDIESIYPGSHETYASLAKNQTVRVVDDPVSTLSIDVDTGSYANVRRFLSNGQMPPVDAVRVEELLNYFDYPYAVPSSADTPFSVTTALGKTPWNSNTRLLHVGLKGYEPPDKDQQPANLVFLIDVSGSMQSPNKFGLLKTSIGMLTQQLSGNDTVSIVVYAGSSGLVLEPTAGSEHGKIISALSRLRAGGSTNGADGINLAYHIAREAFKPNGINRIILATDGDFNVGLSDVDKLKLLISRQRESGIALTTLGFGTANYNDHLMEQLADIGDGTYAYIDTLSEARKVLVDELHSTLMTIALDVKIQIEFNPSVVSEYRLIGYSNRLLNDEDFSDDRVDAGDIGAGHTVTALYEIALVGGGGERHTPRRYGNTPTDTMSSELAEIRLRYKRPGQSQSLLLSEIVDLDDMASSNTDNVREILDFSASVAAFGQLLSGDTRIGEFSYIDARALAAGAMGGDVYGYRAEYLRLVDMADSLHRLSMQTAPHGIIPDKG